MAHPTAHLLRRTLTSGTLRLASRSDCWSKLRRFGLPSLHVPVYQNASKPFHSARGRSLRAWQENEAIVTNANDMEDEGPWMKDMRKRGIYNDFRYGHYHQYKVDSLTISKDKRDFTIHWSDGHTSEFDAIWLRHQCQCGECKHDTNGMVKIEWDSLPMDITILSAESEGDKAVVFQWGTPDGRVLHEGAIPTAMLRCYCYSDNAIKDRRERRRAKVYEDKTIPYVECDEYFGSDEGVHKCLTAVNDRGICLVKNVPTNAEAFDKAMSLIGPRQPTLYGESFDVVATPNPVNAAYSQEKLRLHQDLPFYESPPGLQILHCWSFDETTVGGDNTFLDLHELALQLKRENPELFDRLATLPAVFSSIHYNRPVPVHFENQAPILSLNHLGELVSLSWNPNVQGPPELSKKDMVPFYEAYTTLLRMVAQTESLYKSRFSVGDFLIFNNRRLLHGRTAFSGGSRHLHGGYIQLSDFHSRIQALHNTHGNGRLASRSGSRNWF